MDKLLERVPREAASGSTDQHSLLQEPSEGRTVMVQRPSAPAPAALSDVPVRTLVESGPAIAELRERARRLQEQRAQQSQATGEEPEMAAPMRVPPMPVEPKASRMSLPQVGGRQQATPDPVPARPSTPQPQPARPSTPPPQPAKPGTPPPQASLSEESLFGDLDESGERTRVLQGGRRMPLSSLQTVPTDPARNAVVARTGSSQAPAIIAVLLALILGAGGGVFLYSRMTKQQGFGRLSLKSDRPVTVLLMGKPIGQTPLETVVPAGSFSFELKEEDGTVRLLKLEVGSDAQVDQTVALDSLPRAP